MADMVTLALANTYTKKSLEGAGALKGDKGDSAYQIAVNQGFDGTVDEWLASLKGEKGEQGIQGDRGLQGAQGEAGAQGIQGIQGIQGEKGDDGYPFLIYKQYDNISEFNTSDFPEIGLMFMVMVMDYDPEDPTTPIGYPVYRYTGEGVPPYSLIVHMATEGIKGEKGDKGDKGDTGATGATGPRGVAGQSYSIYGSVDAVADLPDASTTANGTAYLVGATTPRDLYICV